MQDQALTISDKPKIAIRLGHSINAHEIKQGGDVYFECNVQAFPIVRKITWLKNGDLIKPSRQNGVIVANYSLVLQNVRLHDAGYYSCQAENYIGASESNKLELKIKCI